jgi:hypothetical protein
LIQFAHKASAQLLQLRLLAFHHIANALLLRLALSGQRFVALLRGDGASLAQFGMRGHQQLFALSLQCIGRLLLGTTK